MSSANVAERPRLLTLNEQVGSKISPDDEGGAWIIMQGTHIRAVAGNRLVAEEIVYDKAAEEGVDPATFSIEVWHIYDRWPVPDE